MKDKQLNKKLYNSYYGFNTASYRRKQRLKFKHQLPEDVERTLRLKVYYYIKERNEEMHQTSQILHNIMKLI